MLLPTLSRYLHPIYLVLLAFLFSISSANSASTNTPTTNTALSNLCQKPAPFHFAGYVEIGGIPQWLQIRSNNCQFPIILFLHGGPANPISPYANAIFKGWEQQFTLVQWDQRASGKTWLKTPAVAGSTLSLAQMAEDGLALTRLLKANFPNAPVILSGSSSGSALGVAMVQREPQLFAAYVGSAQLVSGTENSKATYQPGCVKTHFSPYLGILPARYVTIALKLVSYAVIFKKAVQRFFKSGIGRYLAVSSGKNG